MKIDYDKQTVLITGATRGIGKQLADDFEECGAQLILTGTRKSQVVQLNKAAAKAGRKRQYLCADFRDKKSTEQFLKQLAAFKRIDVCVNNAGINRLSDIDKGKTEDLDSILNVNLRAPYLITRDVSKKMKKNGYGRIINMSSIFGAVSKKQRSMYSTSKFGLRGLTVASAIDLAESNVLVNTVSPGFVDTDLTRRIVGVKELKKLAKSVPMRRLALPEDISRVVLFLASPLNTYLTGQNIIVDGGYVNV